MYILIGICFGILLGVIFIKIHNSKFESKGIIILDPTNDTCTVKMNTEDIIKIKKKKVILNIIRLENK